MAFITEEHLHHMARRHRATMMKLNDHVTITPPADGELSGDGDDYGRATVTFKQPSLWESIDRAIALVQEHVKSALSREDEVARDAWLDAQACLRHAASAVARAERVEAPGEITP